MASNAFVLGICPELLEAWLLAIDFYFTRHNSLACPLYVYIHRGELPDPILDAITMTERITNPRNESPKIIEARKTYEEYKRIRKILGRTTPIGLERPEDIKKRLSSEDFFALVKKVKAKET